jgi:CRP-like cAMP-binding protein
MVGKRRLVVADLMPPAVFGEMACVGQRMYHCFAEATEPSRFRASSRHDMDHILRRYPDVARRLLELASERFLRVLARLEDASLRPLMPRLARLLLNRAAEDVVRDLTHKEIAQQLRVHRESATSALGELRKAGIISIERRCVRILDRPRLERASRE